MKFETYVNSFELLGNRHHTHLWENELSKIKASETQNLEKIKTKNVLIAVGGMVIICLIVYINQLEKEVFRKIKEKGLSVEEVNLSK